MADREKKIAEIREALEKATPRWHDNGNEIVSLDNPSVGIGGFLREEDNHLAVNAPKWLRFLLSELEHKDDIIEEQKTALFRSSKEIMELREKSWQDQQWFKQASENIAEMQEKRRGNDVSECLSKKVVLESIEEAYKTNLKSPYHTDWDKGFRSALRFVKRAVLSGEFDVPRKGGDNK